MEQKIKILIPDKKKCKFTLENLNKMYADMDCVFDFSDDNEYHILNKKNTEDNIFCVFINIKDIKSSQEAKYYIYDIITTYKNDVDCVGCDFIFLPTKIEDDKIIKLSNTLREIPLMH